MSGLNEIIQWVQSEIILDPTQNVDEQFADISRIFEKDNRSPLADILLDEQPKFLEFLESQQGTFDKSPVSQAARSIESGLNELESDIDGLSREIEQTDIVRTGAGILKNVTRFLKGLFR